MVLDPIVSAPQVPTDAVWLDARPGDEGARAYAQGHVAGAIHLSLDRDLSAPPPDARHGGRHPLPEVGAFCALLGRCGITPQTHVVVYDDQYGANAAARVWWMLRALGHTRVQVFDGGLDAARKAKLPVSSAAPSPAGLQPYPAHGFEAMPQAGADVVEDARKDAARCVIDVRAAERYRGEREPIDPVAGHIPGAVNLPLEENLDPHGSFKPPQALRALYEPVLDGRPPQACIVHCGSGVTACHTLLALERAGLPGAALYVGSWSEWCRHPEWPGTTGRTSRPPG